MNNRISSRPVAGLCAVVCCISFALLSSQVLSQGFSFKKNGDESLDVLWNGKAVARYQIEYDPSTEERNHETYKPYLHLIDPEKSALLTKGSGGLYTHHRGIFIGWNRMRVGESRYDFWHMKDTHQVHQKFLAQTAGPRSARITSLVHWLDPEDQLVIEEERTMEFAPMKGKGILQVDFKTRLKAMVPGVRLDGDPEHAGVQYRPANEVDAKQTTYMFEVENAKPKEDEDYPWVGETYVINQTAYSVVHMNHPGNPKQTKYSAYRDYGRFGAFFVEDLPMEKPLDARYRFLVYRGRLPDREKINALWDEFAKNSVQ